MGEFSTMRWLQSALFLGLQISQIVLGDNDSSKPLPNIVIMLADDLGWHDLSWHNPRVISPHLAVLANDGIVLEQHYSQQVCSPTRGALLTGRYPIHIGLNEGIISPMEPHGLPTDVETLADLLLAAGYSTHAVGKWHLGFCNSAFLPTNRGFQHHYGYWLGAQDYYLHTRSVGHDEGYDFRDDLEVDRSAEGNYSTELYGNRAAQIIRAHNQEKPLFLYLPFQAVHGPLQVPQKYEELYADVPDNHRQTYLGMVTAMDDAVGEVVAALKETDMFESTMIVFMSDNGGPTGHAANNWPLRGSKGSLWEGGTRTPAFIHQPGVLAPREEQGLMHVTDWLPTLLEAVGLNAPVGIDGISHWKSFRDGDEMTRTEMLYNFKNISNGEPIAALRQGSWKYISHINGYDGWNPAPEDTFEECTSCEEELRANPSHFNQLFDLSTDPLEEHNLAEEEPERAALMAERLMELGATVAVDQPKGDDPAGSPGNFGGVWSDGWC